MNIFKKTLLIFVYLGLSASVGLYAQSPNKYNNSDINNNWEININSGLTSYYGDISGYDTNFPGKLLHESAYAAGVIVSKNLNSEFRISGQFLIGKLKGRKNNFSISSNFLEYNIHARLNLLKIINSQSLSDFCLDIYGGIGNFIFNSTKYEYLEGTTNIYKHKSRVPEFVYILG
ncbi:MAG: hypothetical protein K8S16_12155, partial [Bacteroidales bacterium]|nr:hypothetical protein [Bacteroidales bacterium]